MAQEAPSDVTQPPSRRMQLVGERRVPDPSPLTSTLSPTTSPTTPQPNLPHEALTRLAWKQAVLGALNVAIQIVAVRLAVLVAVAGGIALTWLALQEADPMRLGALALYGALVVIPVIWLAGRR